MALGMVPSDPDSTVKAFVDLKVELEKEKGAQETTHIDVNTLTRAVESLKISTDNFSTKIPILEGKVKCLDNKVIDGLNELQPKELDLDRTTKENDDYKSQNAQLTRKLESKFPWSSKTSVHS
jgi:hypothetical protein